MSDDDRRPFVLVTVPHAFTPPFSAGRVSDRVALDAARTLHAELEARGFRVEFVSGDVLRSTCDLNRDRACTLEGATAFRRRVDTLLRARPAYVVDVHSYPRGSFRYLGAETDAAVLYEQRGLSDVEASYVVPALADAGFYAAKVKAAWGRNYVMHAAERHGIPSILFEVAEAPVLALPTAERRATRLRRLVTPVVWRVGRVVVAPDDDDDDATTYTWP